MKIFGNTPGMSKSAMWTIGLSLTVAASLAVMLFLFDPARSVIFPVCHFHQLTGLHCPGCGSLRALHHLIHGEVATAFRCNPLLIVSLPLLTWLAGRQVFRTRNNTTRFPSSLKLAAAWVALGVLILFGILRNLPYPAFAWMSP